MSKINFYTQGEGFPVMLLHGFCETSKVWEAWVKLLPNKFKVYVLDLPGFGKSPQVDATSLADIAKEVNALMEAENIEKTIMIGHSLGGYITLEFAQLFPEKLKGFGLFHSTAYEDDEEKKANRTKTIEFVAEKGVRAFSKGFAKNLFAPQNIDKCAEDIQLVADLCAETSKETFCQYASMMRDRQDYKPTLEAFDRPIFIITGKEDPILDLQEQNVQARLSQYITLHLIDETGHMGMFEQPEETAAMVSGFVNAVSKF